MFDYCGNLVVPLTCRQIGDRAFSFAAPRAWNRLPTELKLLRSMDSFRCDLKTFLFRSVYRQSDTRIRIDFVMRPRSSSRGRNTSASVTVTYVCYNGFASVVLDTSISVLVHLVQYCGLWTFSDPVL